MVSPRRAVRALDPSRPARRMLARLPGAGVADALPRTVSFLAGSEVRRLRPGAKGRPIARPSPQFAAQVVLDEALLGALASSRSPKRSDYPRLGAEVLDAVAVWERHGWVDDPRSYHRDPPPLVDVRVSRRRSRGFSFEHVSFPSGYEPHTDEPGALRWASRTPDRVAHAWVARHVGPPRPWLVCIHGMGMGTPIADLSAFNAKHLFEERGLNLLFPVLPAHGPRRQPGKRLPDVPGADHLDLIHMLAQALWDVRRLVGWVAGQEPTALGAYGISLGGYIASLLACYEPALTSVLVGVPVVDFERLERHHANRSQRALATRHHLLGRETTDLFRVVSPLALPPRLPAERLAVYGGLGDRVATPGQAQLLWEHWGEPPVCWYPGGHIGFMWSGRVERFVHSWMDGAGLRGA
ncbi:MAG: alpha/beta hydrolase family protein [Acidimicrobiales bacterium]